MKMEDPSNEAIRFGPICEARERFSGALLPEPSRRSSHQFREESRLALAPCFRNSCCRRPWEPELAQRAGLLVSGSLGPHLLPVVKSCADKSL